MGFSIELLFISFLIYIFFAVYAFARHRSTLATLFGLQMICSAIWALCHLYEITTPLLSDKIIWLQIKFIFIPFIPLLWLAITTYLTGRYAGFGMRHEPCWLWFHF